MKNTDFAPELRGCNPATVFRAYEPAGPRGRCPGNLDWNHFMDLALEEARSAAREGDVPVGAVLVAPDGSILASGGNRVERDQNPLAHAEILVLAAAANRLGARRLNGCLLIVTLEPCLMCAGAIGHSRVAGVVFGAADQKAGALVSWADACSLPLGGRAFWHKGGIKSRECADLLIGFFQRQR